MNDIISLAKIEIGDATVTFEVSSVLVEAISEASQTKELKLSEYHTEAVVDALKKLLPTSLRLPSHKQESYAKAISKGLDLDLSKNILRTAKNCSGFLEMYAGPYQDLREKNPDLIVGNIPFISQANRVNQWLKVKEKLDSGKTIEIVSEELGIISTTVEEYCMRLGEWNEKSIDDGSFDIVMELVSKLKKGEDISVFYYSNLF